MNAVGAVPAAHTLAVHGCSRIKNRLTFSHLFTVLLAPFFRRNEARSRAGISSFQPAAPRVPPWFRRQNILPKGGDGAPVTLALQHLPSAERRRRKISAERIMGVKPLKKNI